MGRVAGAAVQPLSTALHCEVLLFTAVLAARVLLLSPLLPLASMHAPALSPAHAR